jgi:hypothetical protein
MGEGLARFGWSASGGGCLTNPSSIIGGAVVASVRFVPPAWKQCWAALALTALALWAALAGAAIAWPLALALALIARGGLWRMALDRGEAGPGGLQVGPVEARLLATWLLAMLFLAILALLLTTALLCLTFAVATAGRGFRIDEPASWAGAIRPGGRIVQSFAILAAGIGLVFAAARISLAEPAGVVGGKVQLLAAWPLTRGHALPIAIGNLAVAIAPVAAGAWCLTGARVVAPLVLAAIGAWLWLPMQVGLMAYFFQVLTAPER